MADYLPDPDVRHMRPERGVQDNSTAQAIQGIGNIASAVGDMALESNKQERVSDLGAELEQLNEGILNPADQQRVNAVGSEMDRLARAQRQNPSRTDYTVRAEAVLKKHMAAAPALADEFRAKAGVVLGFNPTGSAIDAHFAQQDAIAKAAAAEEAHIRSTGKQMGMDTRGDIMKPEWQAEYGRRRGIAAAAWEAKNKPALDDNDIGKAASSIYNDFDGRINETTEAVFGKDWRSITPNEWASLDPANRAEYSNRLVEMKFRLPNEILSAYPNATKEQRDVIANSQIGRIDYLLASLDGSKDRERLEGQMTIEAILTSHGLEGTAAGLAMKVLTAQGIEPSARLISLHSSEVLAGTQILVAKQRDADPTPPDGPTKTEEIQAGAKFANNWMRSVDYQSLDAEDRQLASDFTSAYTSMLVRGSLNPNEKQTILEAIADPQVKGFVGSLDSTDETLSNVLQGARSYAIETARGALDELASISLNSTLLMNRGEKRRTAGGIRAAVTAGAESNTANLVTKLVDGQVVTTAKDGSRSHTANVMNKKYTKRLNTAIRAMASAGDMTNEEAANTLFQFRPSAFSWIEGTQQPIEHEEGTLVQDEEGNKFRVVGGKYVREQ